MSQTTPDLCQDATEIAQRLDEAISRGWARPHQNGGARKIEINSDLLFECTNTIRALASTVGDQIPLLGAATELLEGVCELAFILNSTPESGPVCWCCPNCADLRQPGEEHPVCIKLGAAIAKAKGSA